MTRGLEDKLMQKVIVTLPEELLREVDRTAEQIRRNRSEFIREAVQAKLAMLRKKERDALMIEGYTWMAKENEGDAKAYRAATR